MKNHKYKGLSAVLVLFCLLSISGTKLYAQERIHRFGLRGIYQNDQQQMWGTEISYQVYLEGKRRIENNFGFISGTTWDVFQYTGIYQWQLIRKGGFSFYTGPGLGIGYANYGYAEDKFYGVLAANAGIDYTFRLPFQIAIDYRPEYSILNKVGNDIGHQFALAIRLAF